MEDEGVDKVIADRTAELEEWATIVRMVHQRRIKTFAFANNQYAGSAPPTVEIVHAFA